MSVPSRVGVGRAVPGRQAIEAGAPRRVGGGRAVRGRQAIGGGPSSLIISERRRRDKGQAPPGRADTTMTTTLALFCLAIVGVSLLGGLLPLATVLSHTRLQVYL